MAKIELDEAKVWVASVVNQHSHDLIKTLAHRYQVSSATAAATIKKLEQDGVILRSGARNRPVFELATNLVLTESYSLPIQDEEQIWLRDFAPFLLDGLSATQFDLIHAGFVAIAKNASAYSRGKILNVIVEQSLNNIEMTLQDNGVGVFKHIAPEYSEMSTAPKLLNAHMIAHPSRSLAMLAGRFDFFQIEANGMHFPEELAPEPIDETDEELFEQGTTVIMALTLNH